MPPIHIKKLGVYRNKIWLRVKKKFDVLTLHLRTRQSFNNVLNSRSKEFVIPHIQNY